MDDDDPRFDECLARARDGESRAFEELVRWLERPLVGFLRARGAEDAEGTANEVLVRVFGGIDRFEGGQRQFRAWVFRIARNVLIDERRYRSRRPDTIPAANDQLPEDTLFDGQFDRLADRERIASMLDGLTDEQREVLLLRIVAGLSVEATAEVVDRRPGAVRSLQHRALSQLRASLSEKP